MDKQIVDLISRYKGDVEEKAKSISIVAINTLYHSYNDEKNGKTVFIQNKPKKVECKINIEEYKEGLYYVDGAEATRAIVGGFLESSLSLEKAVEVAQLWLERLHFEKRKYEQLTLC